MTVSFYEPKHKARVTESLCIKFFIFNAASFLLKFTFSFNKKHGLFYFKVLTPFKIKIIEKPRFEGCVRYIFTSWFLSLKQSTCENMNKILYFTSKALFFLEKIKF